MVCRLFIYPVISNNAFGIFKNILYIIIQILCFLFTDNFLSVAYSISNLRFVENVVLLHLPLEDIIIW